VNQVPTGLEFDELLTMKLAEADAAIRIQGRMKSFNKVNDAGMHLVIKW